MNIKKVRYADSNKTMYSATIDGVFCIIPVNGPFTKTEAINQWIADGNTVGDCE